MGNCCVNSAPVLEEEKNRNIQTLREMKSEQLKTITPQSLKNHIFFVQIDNVYDGDTYDIIYVDPFSNQYNRKRCRAYGYDSPEMKPLKSIPNREQIKKNAKASKAALIQKVGEGDVICRVVDDKDKYGRLLTDLFVLEPGCVKVEWLFSLSEHTDLLTDERNVCKWMIKNGYAKEYYGGTKT